MAWSSETNYDEPEIYHLQLLKFAYTVGFTLWKCWLLESAAYLIKLAKPNQRLQELHVKTRPNQHFHLKIQSLLTS